MMKILGINSYILIQLIISSSRAEVLPISDQSYPYIYISDPYQPVIWSEKGFAMKMSMSQAIRINSRGVRFIQHHSSSSLVFYEKEFGWKSIPCVLSRDSLCSIPNNIINNDKKSSKTRFFPNVGEKSWITIGNSDERDKGDFITNCPESNTGRTSIFLVSGDEKEMIYNDVSLCNILGSGGDYVYLPFESKLFFITDPISFQMLGILSIGTMFMAIVLAHNLEYTLGTVSLPTKTFTALALMIFLLLASSVFATNDSKNDILRPYITMEDRLACIFIISYVIYYTLRIILSESLSFYLSMKNDDSIKYEEMIIKDPGCGPVNPILATLSMVSMRIYCTLDNPYTTVIAFLVCTRLFHKISIYYMDENSLQDDDFTSKKIEENDLEKNSKYLRRMRMRYFFQYFKQQLIPLDIISDCMLLSLYFFVGFIPQHSGHSGESDSFMVTLSAIQGIYASLTLNKVILMYGNS